MNAVFHSSQKSLLIFDSHAVKRGEVNLEFSPELSSVFACDPSGDCLVLDRNSLKRYVPSDFTDENGCKTYRCEPMSCPVDSLTGIARSKKRLYLSAASGRVYSGKTAIHVSHAPITAIAVHPSGLFLAATDALGVCRVISVYNEKHDISQYLDALKFLRLLAPSYAEEMPEFGTSVREFPTHAWISDLAWSPCGSALLVALRLGGFFLATSSSLHHCECPEISVITGAAMLDARRAVVASEKCGELFLFTEKCASEGIFSSRQISAPRCLSTSSMKRSVAAEDSRVAASTCAGCGFSFSISL